jgi:GNAT superfamily N-acetyltransferase
MKTSTDRSDASSVPGVRFALGEDADGMTDLLIALGYPSSAAQVRKRIVDCAGSSGTAVFVAESAGQVVGLLSFHCIPMFHADGYLGRITSLVVAPAFRERGIGRLLVASAEKFAATQGCERIEVTSGDHRPEAHAFYEHLGYHSDCRRFVKKGPIAG